MKAKGTSDGEIGATRIEHDSMGQVEVPADRYWGAQTQRSLQNFRIGGERMPEPLIRALGIQKKAAVLANMALGELTHVSARQSSLRPRRSSRVNSATTFRSWCGRPGPEPRPT